MRDIVAFVLAGGRGTRMAADLPGVPKPLVEVGGASLLALQLRRLQAAGIREIHLALGHRAEEIVRHVRGLAGFSEGSVVFHVEEQPLGTIGALHRLRDQRRTVLTTNGDLFSAIDLIQFLAAHRSGPADLTLATHDETHRLQLGEVVTDRDGNVCDYLEKPVKRYRISSGTNLLEPSVLALLDGARPLGVPELVRRAVAAGLVVREHLHGAPWMDVNDATDLAQAADWFEARPTVFAPAPPESEFS